ncbi:Transposase [Chitinophaga sp. 180180018-2]|nr:Transposase [Chitinophaga sp. 212800010-3]
MMDNQELEYYITASRIRTRRRRIRAARRDVEKQLLALDRKETALSTAWRQRGYIPLTPPVMKGYKRYFVLRDDVARSKQATFYQRLLDKINTVDYSPRKDFKVKKRSHGRKKLVVKPQLLLQPDLRYFSKLKLSEKETACFEERLFYHKHRKEPELRMVIKEPWRFVLRVRPNMLTQTRAPEPEIQSAMDGLNSYLERNRLRCRIFKLTRSRHSRWNWWHKNNKTRSKTKSLQQLLQEEWYNQINPHYV